MQETQPRRVYLPKFNDTENEKMVLLAILLVASRDSFRDRW
jgi:hypothetical protein